MNILTINILLENEESFIEKFSPEIIKNAFKYGISLQICGLKNENFRKTYKELIYIDGYMDQFAFFKASLENTNSEFVVFFNEHVLITDTLMKEVISYLKNTKKDVVSLHVVSGQLDDEKVRKANNKKYRKQKYMDFNTDIKNPLYFCRYIFRTDFLKKMEFSVEDGICFKEKILLKSLENNGSIKLIERTALFTNEPMEMNVNLYNRQYEKVWYNEFLEKFLLSYVQNHNMPYQVQQMILYFIQLRFYLNLNGRDKFVLEKSEIDDFFNLVKEILKYIDDDVILNPNKKKILPKFFSYLFINWKHDDQFKIHNEMINGNETFFVNGVLFGENCIITAVKAINYFDESLIIDCELRGDYLLENVENQLHVLFNENEIRFERNNVYNITKAFGRSINRFFSFQIEIPYKKFSSKDHLSFRVDLENKQIVTPLAFPSTFSRLINSNSSYFTFKDKIITQSKNKLVIKKSSKLEVFIREISLTFRSIKMRRSYKDGFIAAALRVYYWMTKHKYAQKKNWIFFDKLYKAGDNAQYLFEYCFKNESNANSYYVINKDAIDYKDLKEKYGDNIVEYNSLRHKILVLNASTIFATHASVLAFCGFGETLQKCFRNLLKSNIVCIQHGLTIQNIAQYQNRLKDNTRFYFCASKYEIQNLKKPIYGYYKNELYLTGSPRYDGLVNNDQRQILIAPTWRRNIVITGNAVGTSKEYNPNFKNTTYFKVYNQLINDSRLLKAAKDYGYKLVFLIHPTLSSQVDDYDKNEYLTIIPAISDISYEKILTESSLMLTDYSGIQFDFAYMKKPILYYHPSDLPPQYQEGVYEYETMGFGPIITDSDEIILSLCEQMKNECTMDEVYKNRVEDFFAFTDHDNCRRIHEVIKEHRL